MDDEKNLSMSMLSILHLKNNKMYATGNRLGLFFSSKTTKVKKCLVKYVVLWNIWCGQKMLTS